MDYQGNLQYDRRCEACREIARLKKTGKRIRSVMLQQSRHTCVLSWCKACNYEKTGRLGPGRPGRHTCIRSNETANEGGIAGVENGIVVDEEQQPLPDEEHQETATDDPMLEYDQPEAVTTSEEFEKKADHNTSVLADELLGVKPMTAGMCLCGRTREICREIVTEPNSVAGTSSAAHGQITNLGVSNTWNALASCLRLHDGCFTRGARDNWLDMLGSAFSITLHCDEMVVCGTLTLQEASGAMATQNNFSWQNFVELLNRVVILTNSLGERSSRIGAASSPSAQESGSLDLGNVDVAAFQLGLYMDLSDLLEDSRMNFAQKIAIHSCLESAVVKLLKSHGRKEECLRRLQTRSKQAVVAITPSLRAATAHMDASVSLKKRFQALKDALDKNIANCTPPSSDDLLEACVLFLRWNSPRYIIRLTVRTVKHFPWCAELSEVCIKLLMMFWKLADGLAQNDISKKQACSIVSIKLRDLVRQIAPEIFRRSNNFSCLHQVCFLRKYSEKSRGLYSCCIQASPLDFCTQLRCLVGFLEALPFHANAWRIFVQMLCDHSVPPQRLSLLLARWWAPDRFVSWVIHSLPLESGTNAVHRRRQHWASIKRAVSTPIHSFVKRGLLLLFALLAPRCTDGQKQVLLEYLRRIIPNPATGIQGEEPRSILVEEVPINILRARVQHAGSVSEGETHIKYFMDCFDKL